MDTNLQFQPQVRDATPGDLLEIARNNAKLRYEMGFRPSDRTYYMRAVQGHSRTDVFDEDLLERYTEESLPEVLLHGTTQRTHA